jgi:hypothetical protein
MRLHVDPVRLSETAVPLREAAVVARAVQQSGPSLAAHLTGAGDDALRRAAGDFLEAWGNGLAGLADRGETLSRMLEAAGSSYGEAEEKMRRRHGQAGSGPGAS